MSHESSIIPRVDKLDYRQLCHYIRASQPVISTGEIDHWPAAEKWDFDFFGNRYGEHQVTVSDGTSRKLMDMPFSHFLDFAQSTDLTGISDNRGATPYLQDWLGYGQHPELEDDTPFHHWIRNWETTYTRLFGIYYLPASIFIGPAGACTYLHQDRDFTHAWLSQIKGRKLWHLFPPDEGHLITRREPGSSLLETVNIENPDTNRFPSYHLANHITVILKPGETIFVPAGWWHQVVSLEPTISVTGSYWNSTNMFPFLGSRIKDRVGSLVKRFMPNSKKILGNAYRNLAGSIPGGGYKEEGSAHVVGWLKDGKVHSLAGTATLLEFTIANWPHGKTYTSFTAGPNTELKNTGHGLPNPSALADLQMLSPRGEVKVIVGFSAARITLYGLITDNLEQIHEQIRDALQRLVADLPDD